MDRDPAVLAGQRDHRVVLDVQLLLVADPVRALDDHVGGGERGVHVAPAELEVGEHDVRERAGRTRAAAAPCAASRAGVPRAASRGRAPPAGRRAPPGAGSRRRQGPGSAGRAAMLATTFRPGMSSAVTTATRSQANARVEVDGDQARVGVGRPDRRAVPRAREHQVVGVEGGPGQLGRTLAPGREPAPREGGPIGRAQERRLGRALGPRGRRAGVSIVNVGTPSMIAKRGARRRAVSSVPGTTGSSGAPSPPECPARRGPGVLAAVHDRDCR